MNMSTLIALSALLGAMSLGLFARIFWWIPRRTTKQLEADQKAFGPKEPVKRVEVTLKSARFEAVGVRPVEAREKRIPRATEIELPALKRAASDRSLPSHAMGVLNGELDEVGDESVGQMTMPALKPVISTTTRPMMRPVVSPSASVLAPVSDVSFEDEVGVSFEDEAGVSFEDEAGVSFEDEAEALRQDEALPRTAEAEREASMLFLIDALEDDLQDTMPVYTPPASELPTVTSGERSALFLIDDMSRQSQDDIPVYTPPARPREQSTLFRIDPLADESEQIVPVYIRETPDLLAIGRRSLASAADQREVSRLFRIEGEQGEGDNDVLMPVYIRFDADGAPQVEEAPGEGVGVSTLFFLHEERGDNSMIMPIYVLDGEAPGEGSPGFARARETSALFSIQDQEDEVMPVFLPPDVFGALQREVTGEGEVGSRRLGDSLWSVDDRYSSGSVRALDAKLVNAEREVQRQSVGPQMTPPPALIGDISTPPPSRLEVFANHDVLALGEPLGATPPGPATSLNSSEIEIEAFLDEVEIPGFEETLKEEPFARVPTGRWKGRERNLHVWLSGAELTSGQFDLLADLAEKTLNSQKRRQMLEREVAANRAQEE